jgi:hypothetical protein
MKYTPSNAVTASNTLQYILPASTGPMCYHPSQILFSADVKITKEDGVTPPADSSMVGKQ